MHLTTTSDPSSFRPVSRYLLGLLLVLLLSLRLSTSTSGQALNYIWANRFGSTGVDQSNSIAVDASGNVYTTGYFTGTVDFDPGAGTTNLTAVGGNDMYLLKLDASGNFGWVKSIGSSGFDQGKAVTLDASGNIYVTGSFTNTADFDPGAGTANLSSAGGNEIFVLKLDASGNYIWAKKMGSTANDVGWAIRVDGSGNIHVCGSFNGTVDFDPGASTANLSSVGATDFFVLKLDGSGNYMWAKSTGSTGSDAAYGLGLDASGNIYITGSFQNTADLDPGAGTVNYTASGTTDVYVLKLDAVGNYSWSYVYGGSSSDQGFGLTLDASGNIYVTGYFQNTADFDSGPGTANLTSAGGTEAYVLKLDGSGNYMWAKGIGSTGSDGCFGIAVDGSGNVLVVGNFSNTVDFDPGAGTANLTSTGNADIFVLALDGSGNYISAISMGGSQVDGNQGTSITVDGSNTIYVNSFFNNTLDADPGAGTANLTSAGDLDILVFKLTGVPCSLTVSVAAVPSLTITQGQSATLTASGATSYTWSNGQTTAAISASTAGTYSVTGVTGACSATASVALSVTTAPCALTVGVFATPSLTVCSGSSTTLTVDGVGLALHIDSPTQADFSLGIATFGASLTATPISGPIAYTKDNNGLYTGCTDFPAGSLTGKVALIDRGTPCSFLTKALFAQNAGAIGVIIVNNTTGVLPTMTGSDPSVTIPVASVSQADGATLKNYLSSGSVSGTSVYTTYNWAPADGLNKTTGASVVATPTATTTYSVTVTKSNGCVGTTSVTITANPISVSIAASPSLTITEGQSATLAASGATSYTWSNGQTTAAISASTAGTYSVTGVTGACSATASAVVSVTTAPVCSLTVGIGASPSLAIPASGTATLTASGADSFLWSTGATSASIAITTGGIYSVTGTTGACSATASVTATGADLSPTLILPQANFAAPGSVGNFIVSLYEVNRLPTALGNVTIIVTAPVGYTLAFDNTLTSIEVSGATENPAQVSNTKWTVSSTVENRQIVLVINPGQFIAGGSSMNLGFSITRTTANSGSVSNINAAIQDDVTKGYDGNSANNVYSRVINGL